MKMNCQANAKRHQKKSVSRIKTSPQIKGLLNMNTIVFAVNDTFAPYLYVCLKSLVDNMSPTNAYQVYILQTRLSDVHQRNISCLRQNNLNITFIDMKDLITTDNFYVTDYFTIETYFRFFLPQLFPDLDKVLYLDADTLIMTDIAPLFDIDIGPYYLAATHDYEVIRLHNEKTNDYAKYFAKVLNIDAEKYFQAGCMLINLKKMRCDDITNKLLEQLKHFKKPKFLDQDILNVVCGSNVKYISANWNFTWHLPVMDFEYEKHLPEKHLKSYTDAMHNPYIIHFSGIKPFEYQNTKYTDLFVECIKNTPYALWAAEKFDACYNKNIKQIKILQRKLVKYRILKIVTLGLGIKKYNKKISLRQNDLRRIYTYAIKN